jgi:hypothetical protein
MTTVVDGKPVLPEGLVAVVKRDCPTCVLVAPVLRELRDAGRALTVYSQDDPAFPSGLDPVDDSRLAVSWHHSIETVPTLLRVEGGVEVARTVGWSRTRWEALARVAGLGPSLPEWPGCGSLSVDPNLGAELAVRFKAGALRSRRIALAAQEDEMEALFERGARRKRAQRGSDRTH